jgi:O-antigen/teichoic acid export membrane protein
VAHPNLVVAAKGGSAVFAGRIFAWGSRFLIAVLLARVLGARDYGVYNLALSTATVVAAFGVLGLDAAIVRYTAVFAARADLSRLRGVVETAVGFPAVVAVLLGAGMLVFAEPIAVGIFREPDLVPLMRLGALLVPALVLNQLLAAILQGMHRIHLAVLAEQLSQPFARILVLGVFLIVGLTAFEAMLAAALAASAVAVILAWFVVRTLPAGTRTIAARRDLREVMRFSLPVWFSNVVNTVGGNLQIGLLGILGTAAAVGVFAIANQVTLLGTMFHAALVSASMPLFAQLGDSDDRAGMLHLYRATSKWTFAANLPLFLILAAFPGAILSIFGPEFRAGSTALVVMAFAGLVNAGTGTSGAILDMTGHTRLKLLNSSVAVLLGLGLNLLLIPPLGITGAALAVLSATAALNLMRLVEVAILLRVTPYDREIFKPLVAGMLAMGSAFAAAAVVNIGPEADAAIGILVLGVVYVVAIWRLGISDADRDILGRAWDRVRRRGRPRRTNPPAPRVEAASGTRS